MKNKEIIRFKKIADILRENDDFDLTDNPLSSRVLRTQRLSADDINYISGRKYRIKRPDGQIVEVLFDDYNVEEQIDAYTGVGWVRGEDDDGYTYEMNADFTDEGSYSLDIEPDYDSLVFYV